MTDNAIRISPAATFWVVLSSLALIALLVFSEILVPFVAGFVLAYLFHPIADWMGRLGVHRHAAAFAIIAVVLLAIAIILALIVPPIVDQLSQLIQDLPGYYDRARNYLTRHYGH